MVVDDEPKIVELIEESLRDMGFAPVGFSDPAAAVKAFHDAPGHFAAVITDEVMPVLTGTQLAQRLRAVSPEFPILMISGYGGVALAARAETAGVSRLLAKPFTRLELAQAMTELLPAINLCCAV